MQDRNHWVDYAKAIGIVLVVYGHVVRGLRTSVILSDEQGIYALVDSVIYTFHMPLFFFLSGLFFHHSLKKRGSCGLFLNKIDTIFYPYVLWSLLQGSIEATLSQYTNTRTDIGEVLALLWAPRMQFWFLYALFFVFCLAIVLYGQFSDRAATLLILLGCLLYLYYDMVPGYAPFILVAKNFVYFALGVWFNKLISSIEQRTVPWLIGAGSLFVASQYWFHNILRLNAGHHGSESLLVAISGILFTVCLSMVLARKPLNWALTLGALSMPIYLMHTLTGSGARIILSKFLGLRNETLHIIVGCLAGILVPVIVAKILDARKLTWPYEAPKWLSFEGLYKVQRISPINVHPLNAQITKQ